MPDDDLLEPLHLADQRLIRTVDSLSDERWQQNSVLPGWTRAHVVAHLTLNAEGFHRALSGLQDGETIPVYDSNEARDEAIHELSAAEPGELRQRLFAATTELRHTFGSLTADQWTASVNRLPAGPVWPVRAVLAGRRREVEIHHADLDSGYTAADWPADFAVALLDMLTSRHAPSGSFAIHATDLDAHWDVGDAEPVVSGTAGDLAWWLLGRDDGTRLSPPARLPQIGSWSTS